MFVLFSLLSLAFIFSGPTAFALNITGPGGEITADSIDDIKSVAKTLASAIVSTYNDFLKDGGARGLFSEAGDPYFFWEAGAVWGGLLEYSYLTGDSQFDELISSAVLNQVGENDNFMPVNQTRTLGNDDQTMWGLIAMSAAEMGFKMPESEGGAWVDLAVNVFNDQVQRWDTQTCDGGLRWQIFSLNRGYTYKNSISAANFFLLSARLAAQFPDNTTYSQWAEKTFEWAQDVGFVTTDFHVYDGADAESNCSSINRIQWTMSHATFTEGAAVLFNVTDGDNKWKDIVAGFVNSSSVFRSDEGQGFLYEVACEKNNKCDIDQKAMKGVSVRSYARAAVSAPFTSEYFREMLEVSAIGATIDCDGDENEVKCGGMWAGDRDAYNFSDPDAEYQMVSVKDEGLGEAFSALSVTQALLWPQAKAAEVNSTNPSASSTGGGSPAATGAATALVASPVILFTALLAALCL